MVRQRNAVAQKRLGKSCSQHCCRVRSVAAARRDASCDVSSARATSAFLSSNPAQAHHDECRYGKSLNAPIAEIAEELRWERQIAVSGQTPYATGKLQHSDVFACDACTRSNRAQDQCNTVQGRSGRRTSGGTRARHRFLVELTLDRRTNPDLSG